MANSDISLPILTVTSTGVRRDQAHLLAEQLRIPTDKIRLSGGEIRFLDVEKYIAIPRVEVREPAVVSRFTAATTNHHPAIPIAVTAIDLDALGRIVPFAADLAVESVAAALDKAGLTPTAARPVVRHSEFTTVAVRDGVERDQRRTLLDTRVAYHFTFGGYPLVGPGAQVQVSFSADGGATRLIHATRTLEPGPMVRIIEAEDMRRRILRSLPDDTEVDVQLVYYAPALRNALSATSHWRPAEIIPCYLVTTRRNVIHPDTAETHPLTSRTRLIPATDDSRYVPSATVKARTRGSARVSASATVSGGTPPYSYLWGASNPSTYRQQTAAISYEPLSRDVRRVLPSQSAKRREHISVTVVDANGVQAQAATSLLVTAQPAPDTHNSVTYGCKSPNDPGAWTGDRVAWQKAMSTLGGGSERFCWMSDSSWPGDYIKEKSPGTLDANPWITGDADYQNWGVNTANIVFYIGDANPYVFAEMYPGASPDQYNTSAGAAVFAPNSSVTVAIGSQGYEVPYAGSWGRPFPDDRLQWLPMYACNLLQNDEEASSPWLSWGQAFDGLHSVLAFDTGAGDSNDFVSDFAARFLGVDVPFVEISPTTIVQAWISAAHDKDIGTPAAMGPMTNIDTGVNLAVCNYGDFYWGKGPVGPTITRDMIHGWWYIKS